MFCPIVRGKETEKQGIRRNWLVSVRNINGNLE